MPISRQVASQMKGSSWIRRMFEEGLVLKERFGAQNVFDFSLGNPVMEPPDEFRRELIRCVSSSEAGRHRYMHNAGYAQTREAVAGRLSRLEGVTVGPERVVMTCGAGGGLNVVLRSILNRGENVIVLAPYFVEYLFYVANHGGQVRVVETSADFDIDVDRLDRAITARTRAIIINSPNNPTGKVYGEELMRALGRLLGAAARRFRSTIYLISDEPYRQLVYDGHSHAGTFRFYANSIIVASHSKDLSLPGERIGYAAVGPKAADGDKLIGAMTFCNRTLGFVNAPAIMQRVVARLQEVCIDAKVYARKCRRLCDALEGIGYELVRPGGAFYLFPRSPIADDVAFVRRLASEARVLTVPGIGFGRKGYFRIAYCVDDATIEGAIPGFERVFRRLKTKGRSRKPVRTAEGR